MAGSAPHAFRRTVAKKLVARPTVEFFLDWVDDVETDDEGEPLIIRRDHFHATLPPDERLFMMAALAGDDSASVADEAAAVLGFYESALPAEEFRTMKVRLLDPDDDVSIDMLTEVISWLMEEWANFPTPPSSASSASVPKSGATSTGRVRGQGSTRSTSRSTGT